MEVWEFGVPEEPATFMPSQTWKKGRHQRLHLTRAIAVVFFTLLPPRLSTPQLRCLLPQLPVAALG